MKYFLHDCNSFNNPKILALFTKFGYEGIGLFYTTIERIGLHEKPIKTVVLKSQLRVGRKLNECWAFMESVDLISSCNGETYSKFFDKNYNTNRIAYKSPSVWRIIVARIFLRDNYTCQYCGSLDKIECDHIQPFSKGGEETDNNLITACRTCNRKKKDKPVSDFIKLLNAQKN